MLLTLLTKQSQCIEHRQHPRRCKLYAIPSPSGLVQHNQMDANGQDQNAHGEHDPHRRVEGLEENIADEASLLTSECAEQESRSCIWRFGGGKTQILERAIFS